MVEIDAARIFADASELAFPRASGTEDNRRACRLVADRLREAGLAVAEEEFSYDLRPALLALRSVLIVAALLIGAAGLLAPRMPAVALATLGVGIAVGGILLVWAPGVERIYAAPGPVVTWNVVGRRRSANPRSTFVVLAHYDSKSQNLSLPLRMGATLCAILGAGATAVLATLALAGITAGPAVLPAVTGVVAAVALLTLSTLTSGNASPGGVDNAGSVGILLELARKMPAVVPEDVELVFLSPGAEEDHMIGAMRFLERHRAELAERSVRALNIDGAGAPGRPVMLASYGVWHRFAPALERAARDAARRLGLSPRTIWLPPAIGVDAIPFHHHGVDCLTLSSGSLGRATIAVHSAGDVAANLDPAALGDVARWAADLIVTTTTGARPGSRPSSAGS